MTTTQFPTYVDEFLKQIRQAEVSAYDPTSPDEKRSFVPEAELHRYLNESTIRSLLDCHSIPANEWQSIQRGYLAVFAILLSIHKGAHIIQFFSHEHLADEFLPLLSNDLPYGCEDFFSDFYEAQWRFCAQRLRKGRLNETNLLDKRIIPITNFEVLCEGPDSCTYKVDIYPGYNELLEEEEYDAPATSTFVLKTCPASKVHYHYGEIQAYKDLGTQQDVLRNILRFYGSWKQRQSHNMLLEYADGGTLRSFLERTTPPTKREDIIIFWEKMFDLITLLARVHKHPDPNNRHGYLQGIHHDIKDSNILVSNNRTGTSRFDVTFKLADFGLADFERPGQKKNELRRRDIHGTQMYSAPECYRDETNSSSPHAIREAQTSKDIWSMGCVFSEVAVWLVLGIEGLHEYRRQRRIATDEVPGLCRSAYSGGFHDGEKVLSAVDEMHTRVCEESRASDPIIKDVVGIIDDMLENASSRCDAQRIHDRFFGRVLRKAKANPQSPTSPHSPALWPPAFVLPSDPAASRQLPPEVPPEFSAPALGIACSPITSYPITSYQPNPSHKYPRVNGVREMPRSFPSPDPGYMARTNQHSERNGLFRNASQKCSNGSPPISRPSRPTSDPQVREHEIAPSPGWTPMVYFPAPSPTPQPEVSNTRQDQPSRAHAHTSQPCKTCTSGNAAREQLPKATLDEVEAWIKKVERDPRTPSLKGHAYLNRLDGRDHVFLADDSASMDPYWSEIKRTVKILGYFIKRKDPDGMELRLTSNPLRRRHSKHRRPLISFLESIDRGGQCDIGLTLGKILGEYKLKLSTEEKGISSLFRKKKFGINIYVLTDGIWEDGDGGLNSVVDAIKGLVDVDLQSGQVGIQFVQFGNDAQGTSRLRLLDDGLRDRGVKMDIVDTEHYSGNFFKMLLGAIDRTWDEYRPNPAQLPMVAGPSKVSTPLNQIREVF